mgnify:CR=1 FL=1
MAGFNTAVTGIKATTTALDVTGNNIANASTVGFKASRTEFGDIYSTSVVGSGSSNIAGAGVTVTDLAQDFKGGTIEFTNSNLDLAVNGSGFFQLDDGQGGTTYTRAGAFELDKDGYIVSKNGKFLRGYALDSQGNQMPLTNLRVEEKESPPHHTENIKLAVNLDSASDATKLSPYYEKDDSSSYTYSTTIETYDSLGNTQAIKLNYVEQRPVREVYQFDPAVARQAANVPNNIVISGVTIVWDTATPVTTENLTVGPPVQGVFKPDAATILALKQADPRIDTDTLRYSAGYDATVVGPTTYPIVENQISFELKASATQAGDMVVMEGANALTATNLDNNGNNAQRAANETRTIGLNAAAFAPNADGVQVLTDKTDIKLGVGGGVTATLPAGSTYEAIAQVIEGDFSKKLIANDPQIESVAYDRNSNEIKITWKAEAGDVYDGTTYLVNGNAGTPAAAQSLFNPTVAVVEGDDSFVGTYRLYAYLNSDTLLDIGKVEDPGETGFANQLTEKGPIILNFSKTSGVLEKVNGQAVTDVTNVPKITIKGADPANPNDDQLPTDVDNDVGIQMDISGTTQFASASIQKPGTSQDGYAKGDLIGVTFDEQGRMVASYSNNQKQNLGIVALATFENQAGLQPAGDTEWVSTLASGQASLNPPGTGLNGTLRSAALEQSNVDLSSELVKLIEYQRNYQANSKTLETLNTVTQSILQI